MFDTSYDIDCELSPRELSTKFNHIDIPLELSIFYVAIEPINILLNALIIITFLIWKQFRSQPADIIVAISFSQLLQSLSSFITGILSLNDIRVKSKGSVCQFLGVLGLGGGILESAYSLCFCIYLIIRIR